MKHFIIRLEYKVPIEKIDSLLITHREFLDSGYERKILLSSGPQNPRDGGILIADTGHHRILETGMDGVVRRVIGSGHPGLENVALDKATFNEPQGVCLSEDGLTLYVCDRQNHALRAVDLASGQVRTLAGTGAQGRDRRYNGVGKDAELNSPWHVQRRTGGP